MPQIDLTHFLLNPLETQKTEELKTAIPGITDSRFMCESGRGKWFCEVHVVPLSALRAMELAVLDCCSRGCRGAVTRDQYNVSIS